MLHEFEYEDWEEVDITKPIPIWICLLLIFGILFGGAFMFIQRQKWDFLNSIYFCFITLSTIGFGDFVPKNKAVEGEDQTELVVLDLYFKIFIFIYRLILVLLPYTSYLECPFSSWSFIYSRLATFQIKV